MPSTPGSLTEVVNVKVYQSTLLEYVGNMPSTAGTLSEYVGKTPSTAGILTEVVNMRGISLYHSIPLEYVLKMPSTPGILTKVVSVRGISIHCFGIYSKNAIHTRHSHRCFLHLLKL